MSVKWRHPIFTHMSELAWDWWLDEARQRPNSPLADHDERAAGKFWYAMYDWGTRT